MCFAWISEQTAIISLYSVNLTGFKTEAENVYCAVRTGFLKQTDRVSYVKGQKVGIILICSKVLALQEVLLLKNLDIQKEASFEAMFKYLQVLFLQNKKLLHLI
jgi:hypothetical protein